MVKGQRPEHRRRARLLSSAVLSVVTLVAACSDPQSRYRVLSFFFDGVPEPGAAPPPRGYQPRLSPAAQAMAGAAEERPAAIPLTYSHVPYRDNRCDVCHNPGSGLLFRTAQEGLCRKCHPDVPGEVPFVHGPVAVDDCLACHSPHAAAWPGLLVQDPAKLCLRCHVRAELTTGPHHATIDTRACGDCHKPHGGADRFFLRAEANVAPERPKDS
ncbi:MAG: hypothetical protein AMXMBFR13_19770 [Phycisphaerae bacterium]